MVTNKELLTKLVESNRVINHNSASSVNMMKELNISSVLTLEELRVMNINNKQSMENNERSEKRHYRVTMALIAIISTVLVRVVFG